MKSNLLWRGITVLLVASVMLAACAPAATVAPTQAPPPTTAPAEPTATSAPEATATTAPTAAPTNTVAPTTPPEITVGMLFVGPYNDHGWSQAHYDAGQYLVQKLPGVKFIYVDKVNSADRPGTTPNQLAEDLVSKGAKMIFFTSDDMKDGAIQFAKDHPDIPTEFSSGDTVWADGKDYHADFKMMSDIMGRMEYGKMIAGCAAALTTKTGKIGYLGPLINDETRRLASSVYLGARYCWTQYAGKKAADLQFKVTWIGFWFNIPGVTSDPTQVADDFYNTGYDVVVSGIDTTEALAEASKMSAAGKNVFAVGYDYKDACQVADKVCLGVPYFNWGPSYVTAVKSLMDGTYKSTFQWLGPDWKNINDPDTSMVGFNKGTALTGDASTNVDKFIAELAGGLNLWKGPLNLQDKTAYLKDGETATDVQIWYLPQLLEGMQGQSVPTK